ncbi:peptidoglycan-binding protein [Streptomyces chrestomyceticus]|uniref:Peptidoglycan-binding protein n=1 Tax=Streptomyces chrestomyceticus TaxID=68185 RepID=A0ABU7WLL3_9ACTN
MITTAKTHVGYREGAGNRNKFSAAVGRPAEEWCADFVSAVAQESGNGTLFPNTASCSNAKDWFQRRGRLSAYPAIGAQVFYGDSSARYGRGGSHTEIVTGYTHDWIHTIGGNTNDRGSATGDGVYRRTVSRHSSWTDSYGYPDYPEGIVCADPAWKGKRGVVYFGQEASEADIPNGGGTTTPASKAVTIDGKLYGPGAVGPHVTELGRMLVAAGCSAYTEGPGPKWSTADTESMRRYQLKIGDTGADANGIPGPKQLARLRTEYGPRTHTVAPGDTLSALATTYGTTVNALMKANPSITAPDTIAVGQALNLP